MQEWRVIDGWPDYAVSSDGQVKRIADSYRLTPTGKFVRNVKAGAILKPIFGRDRYAEVGLCRDKVVTRIKISVLVCSAFHGPKPSPHHMVAHWDGNRANDSVCNLRWATHAENEADKERHGTRPRGEKHSLSVLTESGIKEIKKRLRGNESCPSIAKDFGVHGTTIFAVKKGRTWRHIQ